MKRINLVSPVREALVNSGYSTVKVVAAVNAALGELENVGTEEKLGAGSISKEFFKVTNTTTEKYKGKKTVPLIFDAWHSAIEKANKIASFDCVDIPSVFTEWLDKMKEPVAAPIPAVASVST